MEEQKIYCPLMLLKVEAMSGGCYKGYNFSSEETKNGTIIYDGKQYSCIGLNKGETCAQIISLNKLNNIEKLLAEKK